jgi:hypothetical protein
MTQDEALAAVYAVIETEGYIHVSTERDEGKILVSVQKPNGILTSRITIMPNGERVAGNYTRLHK